MRRRLLRVQPDASENARQVETDREIRDRFILKRQFHSDEILIPGDVEGITVQAITSTQPAPLDRRENIPARPSPMQAIHIWIQGMRP